jgi:uncharacterized protein (DUF433 family)
VARAGAMSGVVGECSANPYPELDVGASHRHHRERLGGRSEPTAHPARVVFQRITIDPAEMRGVPCIRGPGIPVATVIGQLAAGRTHEQILADFPDLEREDIPAALQYAAEAVQKRELLRRTGAMVT